MTFMLAQHLVLAMLSGGTQMLSIQVVDRLWVPIPSADVHVAAVNSCADPKQSGEATSGTTDRNGEVQLATPSAVVLITADIEGFDRRVECVQLGGAPADEILRVQLRLRADLSQVTTTHPVPRPRAVGGDPASLTALDFVGVYRDPGGAFYYVSYSEPDALALELPTGAIIYFRKRDRLTFRSPQGVLTFHLQNHRLAGFSYAPNTIRADWTSLER